MEKDESKRCILIVEDDVDINNALCEFLRNEGYSVISAVDGAIGLDKFLAHTVDLVVLDLMLPTMSGQQVLQEVRKVSSVPVIVISALNDEQTQEAVFEFADDYVVKPFSIKIFLYKVGALLRRTYGEKTTQLCINDVRLDSTYCRAYKNDAEIELTSKEYAILHILMSNNNRVYTRAQLIVLIWGYDYYGDERVIDVHIKNIRKKLGATFIETIKGVGYRVEEQI